MSSFDDRISSHTSRGRAFRRAMAAVVLLVSGVAMSSVMPAAAADPAYRIDLRVLVLDDDSAWVNAIQSQLAVEGVLATAVPMASATRSAIDDAFLSSGDRAFYQAVVAPDALLTGLSAAEATSLRAFEAKFSVREVDAYQWANPTVGLNYATAPHGYVGDLNGVTASVTDAGKADGFGYLRGPVPFAAGSYSYVAEPLDPAPAGTSFTTFLGAPVPNGATGSLIGVYTNAGVEQMIISSAFNFVQPQFKYVAHGIVSWATRGVHFGYNRNNFTFQVDDAFSSVTLWDPTVNCTPGVDCPPGVGTERSARMTQDDVTYAVQWMQANNYQLTLAWNGFYADAEADDLTKALQANATAFRWLNHGYGHVFQGCVQDYSTTPWRCVTDSDGNIVWVSQSDVYNEIEQNITVGTALGLPFDPTEYLSGEHSGLFFLPQQPADSPNFIAALAQAGILRIGSDASRENMPRQVGSATTIPRHPTALYYNTSTQADAVDEYNWLYNSRADGGGGYCEDNPAVATCIAPLSTATGFTSYIVPTDAAFDLNFILSNDPRPFYAHTFNLTDDRLAYYLLDAILGKYRSVFNAETPLVNLTLTQAADELVRQTGWAATTDVSGYVQNGQIAIDNPSNVPVPFTAPEGTTINGATLESYGGEVSAWLNAGSTTGTLPNPIGMITTGSTAFAVGVAGAINFAATADPTPTVTLDGTLPAGLTFSSAPGSGSISGTPEPGTGGAYAVTITSRSGTAVRNDPVVITVDEAPQFTSVNATTMLAGSASTFTVTTSGYPVATITQTGTLPTGITFAAAADGTATLSGTPSDLQVGQTFAMTFTATNPAGSLQQTFALTIASPTSIILDITGSTAFAVGQASTIEISAIAVPTPTLTLIGALPDGVTFTTSPGTATISGTPAAGSGGSYPVTIEATSDTLLRTQSLNIKVAQPPEFTSEASATGAVGRSFSFTVTTSGYPAPKITRSGTLPSGITFSGGGNGTARLSGTPTKAGTYTLTFTATSTSGTTRQTFTLTIGRAPSFTSGSSASGTAGRPFSFTVSTTGTPTATITMSGTLQSGLTFVDNLDGTGRISGTPVRGTRTVTFTATNTYGSTTQSVTIRIR